MRNRKLVYYFEILILLLSLISALNIRGEASLAVQFAVQIPIIILIVIFKDTLCPKREQPLIIKIWFIWVFFEVIRGFIVADNEREYKQLAVGTIGMMMPLYIYLFWSRILLREQYLVRIRAVFMFHLLKCSMRRKAGIN